MNQEAPSPNACSQTSVKLLLSTEADISLEALPCGFCQVALDEHFTLLHANSLYYEMYGYTQEEARNAGFINAEFPVYPPDYPKVAGTIRNHLACGKMVFELEHRAVHRTGRLQWMLIRYRREGNALNCIFFDVTARKKMEESLRLSEKETQIALQYSGKIIDVYEIATRTIRQPASAAGELGVPEILENAPDILVERGIVTPESTQEYLRFYKSMHEGISAGEAVVQLKCTDGNLRWFQGQYTLIYDEVGTPLRSIIIYEDITERREKELAYEKWSRYFELQRHNSIGYYEYNLTKNLFDEEERQLPHNLPDSIKTFTGAVLYFTKHFVYEEDIEKYCDFYNRERLLMRFYEGHSNERFEYRRRKEGGGFFWASGTVQLISDPYTADVKAFILVQNIDEEKRNLERIQERIERDHLTGLLNRAAVIEKITDVLEQSGLDRQHIFVMLDIDYFKHLNDSFGHQFGDRVLKDVASIIESTLVKGDLCGRIGGDEFIAFIQNVQSLFVVEEHLRRLCGLLEKNYDIGASISVSVGAAAYPQDGVSFERLYQKADAALYEAKGRGRNQFVIYREKDVL